MRKRLWLVASLLVVMALLMGGCAKEAPVPHPSPPPVTAVKPAEHPRDFPENLRWLKDEEKEKLIEIALNTDTVREWLEKESQYSASIGWIALVPSSSGEGYSGYRRFEYEIVAEGIPRGRVDITPEDSTVRVVSVGVPEEAEIYPEVDIRFGKPAKQIVHIAVDLDKEKVVRVEEYPARKGIVIPPPPK